MTENQNVDAPDEDYDGDEIDIQPYEGAPDYTQNPADSGDLQDDEGETDA